MRPANFAVARDRFSLTGADPATEPSAEACAPRRDKTSCPFPAWGNQGRKQGQGSALDPPRAKPLEPTRQ